MVTRSSWFFNASKHLMLVAVFAMGGFAQVANAGFLLDIKYPVPANSFVDPEPTYGFKLSGSDVIVQKWGSATGMPDIQYHNATSLNANGTVNNDGNGKYGFITKFEDHSMSSLGYTAEFLGDGSSKTANIKWNANDYNYKISHILIKDGSGVPNWFMFDLTEVPNSEWQTVNEEGFTIAFDTWFYTPDGDGTYDFSNISFWGAETADGQLDDFDQFNEVPEPFTAGLVLSGMACSALMMRRRRK